MCLAPIGSILDKWSESSLFAFDEVTRGDGGLYVRNTTVVKPHPFPLIAGNVSILEESMEDLESKVISLNYNLYKYSTLFFSLHCVGWSFGSYLIDACCKKQSESG